MGPKSQPCKLSPGPGCVNRARSLYGGRKPGPDAVIRPVGGGMFPTLFGERAGGPARKGSAGAGVGPGTDEAQK